MISQSSNLVIQRCIVVSNIQTSYNCGTFTMIQSSSFITCTLLTTLFPYLKVLLRAAFSASCESNDSVFSSGGKGEEGAPKSCPFPPSSCESQFP